MREQRNEERAYVGSGVTMRSQIGAVRDLFRRRYALLVRGLLGPVSSRALRSGCARAFAVPNRGRQWLVLLPGKGVLPSLEPRLLARASSAVGAFEVRP